MCSLCISSILITLIALIIILSVIFKKQTFKPIPSQTPVQLSPDKKDITPTILTSD